MQPAIVVVLVLLFVLSVAGGVFVAKRNKDGSVTLVPALLGKAGLLTPAPTTEAPAVQVQYLTSAAPTVGKFDINTANAAVSTGYQAATQAPVSMAQMVVATAAPETASPTDPCNQEGGKYTQECFDTLWKGLYSCTESFPAQADGSPLHALSYSELKSDMRKRVVSTDPKIYSTCYGAEPCKDAKAGTIAPACLQSMWAGQGCTTTVYDQEPSWRTVKTPDQVKAEMKKNYAETNTDKYKLCWGANPCGSDGRTTGPYTAMCLQKMWQSLGCTKTLQSFKDEWQQMSQQAVMNDMLNDVRTNPDVAQQCTEGCEGAPPFNAACLASVWKQVGCTNTDSIAALWDTWKASPTVDAVRADMAAYYAETLNADKIKACLGANPCAIPGSLAPDPNLAAIGSGDWAFKGSAYDSMSAADQRANRDGSAPGYGFVVRATVYTDAARTCTVGLFLTTKDALGNVRKGLFGDTSGSTLQAFTSDVGFDRIGTDADKADRVGPLAFLVAGDPDPAKVYARCALGSVLSGVTFAVNPVLTGKPLVALAFAQMPKVTKFTPELAATEQARISPACIHNTWKSVGCDTAMPQDAQAAKWADANSMRSIGMVRAAMAAYVNDPATEMYCYMASASDPCNKTSDRWLHSCMKQWWTKEAGCKGAYVPADWEAVRTLSKADILAMMKRKDNEGKCALDCADTAGFLAGGSRYYPSTCLTQWWGDAGCTTAIDAASGAGKDYQAKAPQAVKDDMAAKVKGLDAATLKACYGVGGCDEFGAAPPSGKGFPQVCYTKWWKDRCPTDTVPGYLDAGENIKYWGNKSKAEVQADMDKYKNAGDGSGFKQCYGVSKCDEFDKAPSDGRGFPQKCYDAWWRNMCPANNTPGFLANADWRKASKADVQANIALYHNDNQGGGSFGYCYGTNDCNALAEAVPAGGWPRTCLNRWWKDDGCRTNDPEQAGAVGMAEYNNKNKTQVHQRNKDWYNWAEKDADGRQKCYGTTDCYGIGKPYPTGCVQKAWQDAGCAAKLPGDAFGSYNWQNWGSDLANLRNGIKGWYDGAWDWSNQCREAFHIQSKQDDKQCLGPADAVGNRDTNVVFKPEYCAGSDMGLWYWEGWNGDGGRIRHAKSGNYIGLQNGTQNPGNGTRVLLDTDAGQAAQIFKIYGNGAIQHKASGQCLHPKGGNPGSNVNLITDAQCSVGSPRIEYAIVDRGWTRRLN